MEKLVDLLINSPLMGKRSIQALIKASFGIFVLAALTIIIWGLVWWSGLNYENIEKISSIFTWSGFIVGILFLVVLTKEGSDAHGFEKELQEITNTGKWSLPRLVLAFVMNHDEKLSKSEITEIFSNALPGLRSVRANKLDATVFSNLSSPKGNRFGDEIDFKRGCWPLLETKWGKIALTSEWKRVADSLFPK